MLILEKLSRNIITLILLPTGINKKELYASGECLNQKIGIAIFYDELLSLKAY
jgi:hypothetical protein